MTVLGTFEGAVLQSVAHLRGEGYGTPIRQRVSQAISRDISIGALYTTLTRLEKKGLICSRIGEATKERGGRAKRYFSITADGIKALSQWQGTAERIWATLPAES